MPIGVIAASRTAAAGHKQKSPFLPNTASEMIPPHVGTVSLKQGNLDYVADLAVKINTRAKIDFDNGREAVCSIFDLQRDDVFRAFS